MATIRELKDRIDLHDLAGKLGLVRPGGGGGNYRSPHHDDRTPSLSIFNVGRAWKDHSSDEGGDCVALVEWVEGCDTGTAVRRLHELYAIQPDTPQGPRKERSKVEYIAAECRKEPRGAYDYLKSRGIAGEALERAVMAGALGCNTWTSPTRQRGEIGYGGPAAAFIVRDWHSAEVVAVDFRYLDAEANGGLKTQSQGTKDGVPWFISRQHIERARTVYIVESAINALCVESCNGPGWAALALRGTGNAATTDWRMLRGKRVVLALDADPPDKKGFRPGSKAAWAAYDALTRLDIAALMVDQSSWYADGLNDLADIAKAKGLDDLRTRLEQVEPWIIQGLPGKDAPPGKSRIFLPAHDWAIYWRFRTKEDFTSYVGKIEEDDTGKEQVRMDDVAGFRIAAVSRVTIASATSTMSGEDDAQPSTVFAVSVQTPRYAAKLLRRVLPDDRLHNVEAWKKLGPIFNPSRFLRMLNILERSADCGATEAINFVGLAWRHGRLTVNEGPDCFFSEPEKQCPYHNLVFPSGAVADARRVIEAYQRTFRDNAAALVLVWALGGHLKAVTGFWPHCTMQADKGSGKSTLVKRIERSIGMTMFGGQSLQTEFRLLTSVSHTSHPVGWEELSARKQDVIDRAVAMLQECYQHTVTRRGSEMTEYLQCAPVLLAGEDVPVRSLTGKVIRTDLTGRKGDLLPEGLPRFPVREWLQHLVGVDRGEVLAALAKWERWLWAGCRSRDSDPGAVRMVANYAAVLTAWGLLCDFSGMATESGDFPRDIRATLNNHLVDSKADREPWVWILELVLSEIESRQFIYPYTVDMVEGEDCLLVQPRHVMDHLATTVRLREHWNGLPVKSARVLRRQLDNATLIVKDELERRIGGRRHAHLAAISLKRMAEYGLHLSVPVETEHAH